MNKEELIQELKDMRDALDRCCLGGYCGAESPPIDMKTCSVHWEVYNLNKIIKELGNNPTLS